MLIYDDIMTNIPMECQIHLFLRLDHQVADRAFGLALNLNMGCLTVSRCGELPTCYKYTEMPQSLSLDANSTQHGKLQSDIYIDYLVWLCSLLLSFLHLFDSNSCHETPITTRSRETSETSSRPGDSDIKNLLYLHAQHLRDLGANADVWDTWP